MALDLLGRAMGICLAKADNLKAVYLPEGAPRGIPESIVREANSRRPTEPPYAILVSSEAGEPGDGCVRVWPPENVIKYRQGDRLVVALDRHSDFQSISTSFLEVVGLSYPHPASGLVALREVAAVAIDLILHESGVPDGGIFNRETAVLRLEACLEQLSEIHVEMRRGDFAWNAQWFAHVAYGLDRIAEMFTSLVDSGSSVSLDEAFANYTFASFSLPRPSHNFRIKSSGVGKAVVSAIDDWWPDGATVRATVDHLQHHPDTESDEHPLAELEWDAFDADAVTAGSPLVAMLCRGQHSLTVIEAFAHLTTSQFLDPTNHLADKRDLIVQAMDQSDLSMAAGGTSDPFLLISSFDDDSSIRSMSVRVRIPTLAVPTASEIAGSVLGLVVSPSTFAWDGVLEADDHGSLWAVGEFTRKIGSKNSKAVAVASVSLDVPPGDPLAHLVPAVATCVFHLLPPVGVGVTISRIGAKGTLGKPTFLGIETIAEIRDGDEEPIGQVFPTTFDDSNSSFRIVAWDASATDEALHDGKPMGLLGERPGLFVSTISPTGLDVIELAGHRFELSAPEQKTSIQSPIVAAINRQQVSGEKPSAGTVDSFRGVLEEAYSRHLSSGEWLHGNGHIVIAADRDEIPLGEFSALPNDPAFLMNALTGEAWDYVMDEQVPSELLESKEASAFRDAFNELGTPGAMKRDGSESTEFPDWISRTSWRYLWTDRREALDTYLDAYAALISKAREIESPIGVFWASFPFSTSVWDTKAALSCSAVMLSPLHPIRLAWLASVEGTLWRANDAGSLAGTVEGWNFPFIGPRHTASGRMVAIPMDSGEGQIFLGWSMLVNASIDGELPLVAPYRIGRVAAPGSAASGLNATAATSALRSYRKLHPHVSTLTIDLAAASNTSRLEEVDQAVLAQLEAWAHEKSGSFRGGARVLDSLRREGNVPSLRVAEVARKNPGMPVMWSRYEPIPQKSQECNIRLLQDSGVHVAVSNSDLPNRGVISKVPLRRFEGGSIPGAKSKVAYSRPALIPSEQGWASFDAALNALEGASSHPQLSSKLHKSALVDDRADWTVSGESLLSPAAMAALLKSGGGATQMLWEWRPPFLEPADDVPALERRPYVSVARVPFGFKTRLKTLLEKATGESTNDAGVGDLLGTLGARGVGLSSLLAMGGSHASGALGFYLAFALAELANGDSSVENLALPIDACDTFLKALAAMGKHGESTQRADILILSLSDEALTLVPVEIKFIGIDKEGDNGHLPGPLDAPLAEAREQLESTMKLLRQVEARGLMLRADGCEDDRALWDNALTTLVEAGIRLKPAGSSLSEDLPARLQRVAAGTIPLRVGKPLVTYFKHGAIAADGSYFGAHTNVSGLGQGNEEFGALVANSKVTFEALDAPNGAMAIEWKRLVGWAVKPVSDSLSDSAPATRIPGLPMGASTKPSEDDPRGQRKLSPAGQHESKRGVTVARDGDPSGQGIRFPVGNVLGSVGTAMADFWPSNTALNQMNIGVVGDLGTGKTQLLKALVLQLRREAVREQPNPLSMLVFDYKKDFQDEIFLDAVGGRVLRPQGIPLNIFALAGPYSPLAAYQKASSFCDVLSKIYAGVGPVQRDRLITIVTDLFKNPGNVAPTLAEVRDKYVQTGKPDSVTGILNTFVIGEIFSSDRAELVTFDELISDTVLIVALSDLGADQNVKNSLVALFLNFYYDFMRTSKKWPFVGTEPQLRRLNSFLLVDEAVNIMSYSFDVLMDIMLQGREFGFGTILSSQYLSHFKIGSGPNYGEPLLTWFIHKVPSVTVKQLIQLGIPGASESAAQRISVQKVHEAYFSSLAFKGRFIEGIPFYKLAQSNDD